MAYSETTGIANVQDLINNIVSALTSAGWTIDRNNLSGSNRTATVRAPGGSDYIHIFNTDAIYVRMRVSIGYSSGDAPSLQPNVSPFDSMTNVNAGTYTRVFFNADGDEAFVSIELAAAGEFRHLAFGVVQKFGSFTGGTYADGSYRDLTQYLGYFGQQQLHHVPFSENSNNGNSLQAPYPGFIRADVSADSLANYYHRIGSTASDSAPGFGVIKTGVDDIGSNVTTQPSINEVITRADRNIFSGRSVAQPINLTARRVGSPAFWSPIGYPKNIRFVNLAKYNVGHEETIGLDTWKMFPFFKRSLTRSIAHDAPNLGSWILGFAVKKVP